MEVHVQCTLLTQYTVLNGSIVNLIMSGTVVTYIKELTCLNIKMEDGKLDEECDNEEEQS